MVAIELEELHGGQVAVRHRFSQRSVRIGRHPGNDLVLTEAHVSARHAKLACDGDGARFRDLQSTNGSVVVRNGQVIPVDEHQGFEIRLVVGDELLIGDPETPVHLVLSSAGDPARVALDTLADTTELEVLARIDVSDADEVRALGTALGREALLALYEFGTQAGSARSTDALLKSAARTGLELFPDADRIRIFLQSPGHGRVHPILVEGRSGSEALTPLSSTVETLIRNRLEAVSFSVGDPSFDGAESLRTSAVQVAMCAPLLTAGALSGVLQVDCSRRRRLPFGPDDLKFLAVLCAQLGLALENLRLNSDLKQTVAELRKAQTQMETLAFRDPLTGLSNRRLLQDRLEQAVKSGRRLGQGLGLLYLDLDDFKRINDSFGHDVGDQVLQAVGERLEGCLRGPDTVARLGGDEFAAVLVNLPDASGARTVARKIRDALRRPIEVPGHSVVVTASIGITMSPSDGNQVTALMRNADLAMYRCKSRGGDGFSFFTEDLNREAARRLTVENELRAGLADRQFIEHFQPFFSFDGDREMGMEALVRWHHPRRGLTMPDDFIGVAEDTGLIVTLGRVVMRNACLAARALASRRGRDFNVAVNLSARQFLEPDLPEMVRTIIGETGLRPELLELEITESMLMEDSSDVRTRLTGLKDLGVSLTIDDFGTGYSSLSYLKRLPVDCVKIDRSFVHGIPDESADSEIAAAIIAMGHKLGLKVVAEGVETAAQLEFLRANQCDVYQGFLRGRPAPLDELVRREAS